MALNTIKENENVITDLNTEDQLFEQGIDAKGNKLPLPYAPATIQIKRFKGQPTDRITLRDTGSFHDSFFVKASRFPVEIDARDPKRDELLSEWGDILGLTDENIKEVAQEYILEDLQKALRNALR